MYITGPQNFAKKPQSRTRQVVHRRRSTVRPSLVDIYFDNVFLILGIHAHQQINSIQSAALTCASKLISSSSKDSVPLNHHERTPWAFDVGIYNIFSPRAVRDRPRYVKAVQHSTSPLGQFLQLCFLILARALPDGAVRKLNRGVGTPAISPTRMYQYRATASVLGYLWLYMMYPHLKK